MPTYTPLIRNIWIRPNQNDSCFTFLTSVWMTIATLHVIPFIAVFHTKCVHTIFSSKIIWLISGPSCKVSFFSIHPTKVAFYGSIIQAQPRFGAIMSMLEINILFIAADINKDRVFLPTVLHRSGPVCTSYTCKVAVAIKVAPTRITDVWEKDNYLLAPYV